MEDHKPVSLCTYSHHVEKTFRYENRYMRLKVSHSSTDKAIKMNGAKKEDWRPNWVGVAEVAGG